MVRFAFSTRRLIAGLGLTAGLAVLGAIVFANQTPRLPPGISSDEYEQAAGAIERKRGSAAELEEVLIELGESAASKSQWETALACFAQIPEDHPRYGHLRFYQQGQLLIELNRLGAAEENLKRFLELEERSEQMAPEHRTLTRRYLSYLLAVQLRFEERRQLLADMIRSGEADTFDILAYCFPSSLVWNSAHGAWRIENGVRQEPENVQVAVALGRYRTGQGRIDEARQILEDCCREEPDSLPAKAALLACHFESGDDQAMDDVAATLPPTSDSEPWLLLRMRGHMHHRNGEYREAVDCFQRVLLADPANVESHLGLARAFASWQEPEKSRTFAAKAGRLARIQNRLGSATQSPDQVQPLAEIAEICEEAGLKEQAWIVGQLALSRDPMNATAQAVQSRLAEKHK